MTSKNFPDFLTLPSKINYGRPFRGWKDFGHVLTPHFPLSVVYWSPDEIFKKPTFVRKARNCKVHPRSIDKWCLKWALLVLAVECQIFSITIAGRSEICRTWQIIETNAIFGLLFVYYTNRRHAHWLGLWYTSAHFPLVLTRHTWLIHTSVLPSNWNLDKIFALTGQLGQVHVAKKIFVIFLHAGDGVSWTNSLS